MIDLPLLRNTITVTNRRDLEIKMNRYNQNCSTVRGTLNSNTTKDTEIHVYKAMAVPTLA
jgi:hypothetical protein